MNISILLYNNKYYILKIIYYSYSSVVYIGSSVGSIGNTVHDLGKDIYDYFKKPEQLKIEYKPHSEPIFKPLPSAPSLDTLRINSGVNEKIKEYIMIEKDDLLKLINNSNDMELFNKYFNHQIYLQSNQILN